jgi:hypothetical protein
MSAEPDDNFELPDALRETRNQYGAAPTYHVLRRAVVEGRVPADRVGVRYVIKRADLPQVAALATPSRPRAA